MVILLILPPLAFILPLLPLLPNHPISFALLLGLFQLQEPQWLLGNLFHFPEINPKESTEHAKSTESVLHLLILEVERRLKVIMVGSIT